MISKQLTSEIKKRLLSGKEYADKMIPGTVARYAFIEGKTLYEN